MYSKQRRTQLCEQLPDDSLVILSSANTETRNHDTDFPFRQDSNFFYLTEFNEPASLMVIEKVDAEQIRYILFCRPADPAQEQWEGRRAGLAGAVEHFGADDAYPIADVDDYLPELLANKNTVYYDMVSDARVHRQLPQWLAVLRPRARRGINPPLRYFDLHHLLAQQRCFKQADEIDLLRRVGEISAQAHVHAMHAASGASYEYQLQAVLEKHCNLEGCQAMAYPSIVAAGSNACVLHYASNRSAIQADDYILIDAGGELNNYAADITRTFPKSGQFSGLRRQVYEIVLEAQLAGISKVTAGTSWADIQQAILQVLAQGLIDLRVVDASVDTIINDQLYKPYYMHGSGHWLGLDVHDVGEYYQQGRPVALKSSMVLTVEPGLYFDERQQQLPDELKGLGIRIEDDVLVTDDQPEVLTASAPKTIEGIETLMLTGGH